MRNQRATISALIPKRSRDAARRARKEEEI